MSELPEGWELSSVDDLGVEVRDSARSDDDSRYELYSVPCFPTGRPEVAAGEEIGSAKRLVEPGDVLLCKINPRINRVWKVGPSTDGLVQIASTEYFVLRTTEPTLGDYLMWYFRGPRFRDWIKLSVEGATGSHTRVKSPRIKEQVVPIPPLLEQRRIVDAIEEHFSRLDEAENLLDGVSRRMERLRESAVEAALVGDWPVEPLSSRTVEQRYGTSAKASEKGDVPVLRMGNIQDGRLDYGKLKYLPRNHADVGELQLRDGDLLFNRTNSAELVGKSAVFHERSGPVTFASYLIRARLDERLDPAWASVHINSRRGRSYIDSVVTQQVGQANVNGTKLKNFPIPVPPIEVQRARMARLGAQRTAIDDLQAELERSRRRLAALRRSILAAAFSGRLVPQNPADEPASVLLDRIAAERPVPKSSRRKKKAAT